MPFENIFEKLEATTTQQWQCRLKPIAGVCEQVSKNSYKNLVTGRIVSRQAFERLQDRSPAGSFIVKILCSQPMNYAI